MTTTEKPFNAPVQNCETCVHRIGKQPYATCAKAGFYPTENAIHSCKFKWWQPRPPKPSRRSLLQWIVDTFLRID